MTMRVSDSGRVNKLLPGNKMGFKLSFTDEFRYTELNSWHSPGMIGDANSRGEFNAEKLIEYMGCRGGMSPKVAYNYNFDYQIYSIYFTDYGSLLDMDTPHWMEVLHTLKGIKLPSDVHILEGGEYPEMGFSDHKDLEDIVIVAKYLARDPRWMGNDVDS